MDTRRKPVSHQGIPKGCAEHRGHAKTLADLSREELLEIPGIGKDLADKIEEYLKTGKVVSYEDLKKKFPKVLLNSFLCQASD